MTVINIDTHDIFAENDILHHATRAKINRISASLTTEYPALQLEPTRNESGDTVVSIVLTHRDSIDGEATIVKGFPIKEVPTVGELAGIAEDEGFDPEAIEIEEGPSGGNIVPDTYRKMYKENSTSGQTCGDWLAEFLTDHCFSFTDGFNVDAFQAVLNNNDVDQSGKWASLPQSGQRGWVGRWRMNGRQSLEKFVARAGFVIDPNGNKHKLPKKALEILRNKHGKWIAKQEKLEAALKQD